MSRNPLLPRDHGDAVALFRASIVGAVVQREMSRGELAAAIRALAECRYRPPGSRVKVLRPVDAVGAGKTRRKPVSDPPSTKTAFDPPRALLDQLVGRPPRHGDSEED